MIVYDNYCIYASPPISYHFIIIDSIFCTTVLFTNNTFRLSCS